METDINKEVKTTSMMPVTKILLFNDKPTIDNGKAVDPNSSSIEEGSTSATVSATEQKGFDYSYVVLFASFIAYMLAALLSSCFGVFFDSMASDLNLSKSQVAFIGACLSALDNLLGPISSAFINRYGCRKTCIIGGLFSSIGIIASSYVNEFWLIGLFMGIVSGFGTSLVLVSTVVVVTYYFEDKPSFASGFVISGGSFGQSIFSLIIIKLNNVYGRSGCFLILGGLLLNIVVCGALFRPLDWELEDGEEEEEEEDDEEYDEEDEEEEETTTAAVVIDDDLDEGIGNIDEELNDEDYLKKSSIEKVNDDAMVQYTRDIDLPFIYDLNMCEKFSYNDVILDKRAGGDYTQPESLMAATLYEEQHHANHNRPITFLQRVKNFFGFSNKKKQAQKRIYTRPAATLISKRGRSYSISAPFKPRHHHHHHHHYHHPNLPGFVNAYRLPLYLRNLYYKSLINLNTRLLAEQSPLNQSNSHLVADLKQRMDLDSTYQLSLSCPNLVMSNHSGNNRNSNGAGEHLTVNDLNYRLNKYRVIMNNMKSTKLNNGNDLSKNTNNKIKNRVEEEEDVDVEAGVKNDKKNMKCFFIKNLCKTILKLFKRLCNSINDTFKLFRIIPFAIFALCNFILSLFYETPFYFINSYMVENDFTQNKAGLVTVAIGVVCIFAAIAYGYIGDLKRLNWIIVYSFSLVLTGCCSFLIPFVIKNYALTMITMVCMGVFISVNDVLVPMICVNTVGCDDFVSAYGLILFCQGISSLVGPPLLGMIVDYFGNYAYSYYLCGSGMCLSGIILLTILIHKKLNKKSKLDSLNKTTTTTAASVEDNKNNSKLDTTAISVVVVDDDVAVKPVLKNLLSLSLNTHYRIPSFIGPWSRKISEFLEVILSLALKKL